MNAIVVKKSHQLGLDAARAIAIDWAHEAEKNWSMVCRYEEGENFDRVFFVRSQVSGSLLVQAGSFELNVELGILLWPMKQRIQEEILRHLEGRFGVR